ncbi:hypothetical protein WIW50_05045 [Flavobacteriaceae bacterium 3-367]
MKQYVPILTLLFVQIVHGQKSDLAIFEHLIGKTWIAEGNWGDGSKFKQESTFEYALNKQIVIARSKGYVNQEQTRYGLRNHGIRKFDPVSKGVKFWEFDVFGGLTEGTMSIRGKDIFYHYSYHGSLVTDHWEYVDDTTYNFIVGRYVDEKWEQVYLKTQFKAQHHYHNFLKKED